MADVQATARRRLGAEVRVERDQPLDLVQRPAGVLRQRRQLLARQPAEPVLDRVQRRDQARPGEPAVARLGTGRAAASAGPSVTPADAGSSATAQNLNSGILPTGSISSMVSRFAAASRKWNGMNTLPRRLARRHPHVQLDLAAPRPDPGHAAVDQPERARVVGVQVDLGARRDGVQGERPPRHRAGVPVLEQPAGVEHERVLVVRQLLGRQPLGGHQVGQPVGGVEPVVEHHDGAVGVLRVVVRVELAGAAEVVPAEVAGSSASAATISSKTSRGDA